MAYVRYPSQFGPERSRRPELRSSELRDVSRRISLEQGVVVTPRQIAEVAAELEVNGRAFGFDPETRWEADSLLRAARKATQHLYSLTEPSRPLTETQRKIQDIRRAFWGDRDGGWKRRDELRPLIIEALREMGARAELHEDRYVRIVPDARATHPFSRLAEELSTHNHDLCFSIDNAFTDGNAMHVPNTTRAERGMVTLPFDALTTGLLTPVAEHEWKVHYARHVALLDILEGKDIRLPLDVRVGDLSDSVTFEHEVLNLGYGEFYFAEEYDAFLHEARRHLDEATTRLETYEALGDGAIPSGRARVWARRAVERANAVALMGQDLARETISVFDKALRALQHPEGNRHAFVQWGRENSFADAVHNELDIAPKRSSLHLTFVDVSDNRALEPGHSKGFFKGATARLMFTPEQLRLEAPRAQSAQEAVQAALREEIRRVREEVMPALENVAAEAQHMHPRVAPQTPVARLIAERLTRGLARP